MQLHHSHELHVQMRPESPGLATLPTHWSEACICLQMDARMRIRRSDTYAAQNEQG
jgi:hypothetical protein